MPDSMGKRKRRDVTARKHAAREERRVRRSAPPSRASFSSASPRGTTRLPRPRMPPGRSHRSPGRRSPRGRTRGARPRREVQPGVSRACEGRKDRGPDAVRRVLIAFGSELDGANVRGLRALLALGHVVLHLLVLLQVAETLTGDRAEMHEHVGGTVVRSDESEALLGAEPLHGSDCHVRSLLPFAVRAWLLPFTAPAVAAG